MFKKLNKKGFTLIELLAVIIILAILIAVAVPAVTRYLTGARKDTFVSNAKSAIQAVADDVVINGMKNPTAVSGSNKTSTTYSYQTINELLDTKLDQSPFGKPYSEDSFITVEYDPEKQVYTYSICLVDDGNNGFSGTAEQKAVAYENITSDKIKVGNAVACQ